MRHAILQALVWVSLSFSVMANTAPKEMFWDELLPDGFDMQEAPIDHNTAGGAMAQQWSSAPMREELNGQLVKIPGFVVPLEGDDDILTEFLLVPYFGACIHAPPPPSNQIIHVKFPQGAPVESLYDAIWLTGTISTQGWSGDLAEVGYSMTGTEITLYDE